MLGPLTELAERTNVAISTLTHPPKASDANVNALNHFIGSQAFIAVARIGHLVLHDEARERYLFTNPKNNNIKPQKTLSYHIYDEQVEKDGITVDTSFVKFDPVPLDLSADQAIALVSGKETKKKRQKQHDEIEKFIKDMVPYGADIPSAFVKDAAAQHGHRWMKVLDVAKEIGIEFKKSGLKEGWVWRWKPNAQSPSTPTED